MQDNVRVRFAPSPTGALHIGGVRTALYNYLFARKNKGTFILRIEDTDQSRFVPGAEEYIIETLAWCGLDYDEGPRKNGPSAPYRQSERLPLYRQYAEKLVADGHAYYAFDTPEELEAMRQLWKTKENPTPQYDSVNRLRMKNGLTLSGKEVNEFLNAGAPHVIRIKMPEDEKIRLHDMIRGEVSFHSAQLDDKVLFKSDGFPTYHLANVVDDHLMRISHVIRGEEWLPSSPLHIILYRFLGWEATMPKFAHLPLILKPEGSGKLSKRDGDKHGFPVFPLQWIDPESSEVSAGFREIGFMPAAFLNMLAFLGWNPGNEKEIFSLTELKQSFSFERVGKAGARFDYEKAKWYNQQYLLAMSDVELARILANEPSLASKSFSVEYLTEAVRLMKERVTFLKEIPESANYLFGNIAFYDQQAISKKWNLQVKNYMEEFSSEITEMSVLNAENLEQQAKALMQKKNLGMGQVMPVLRLILCGILSGPPIFDVAVLLGKKVVLQRIKEFLEKYKPANNGN